VKRVERQRASIRDLYTDVFDMAELDLLQRDMPVRIPPEPQELNSEQKLKLLAAIANAQEALDDIMENLPEAVVAIEAYQNICDIVEMCMDAGLADEDMENGLTGREAEEWDYNEK